MFLTLEIFGFGTRFIEWIKHSYSNPVSSILSNADRSLPFELQCGVRQGDLLSPLLFNIALEPLAIGIRSHPDIHGIKLGDSESLVNLYADDAVTNPEKSVPHLFTHIKSFGRLSGYTINWDKSELMPLKDNLSPVFLNLFHLN